MESGFDSSASNRDDGWMWLYVDGTLEVEGGGPAGDISYPDDGRSR